MLCFTLFSPTTRLHSFVYVNLQYFMLCPQRNYHGLPPPPSHHAQASTSIATPIMKRLDAGTAQIKPFAVVSALQSVWFIYPQSLRGCSHDTGMTLIHSRTSSFHLHIFLFICLPRRNFVSLQVIPVFNPNEIFVLV